MTSSIGVKLYVKREDAKAAARILEDLDAKNISSEEYQDDERAFEEERENDEDDATQANELELTQREQTAIRAFRSAVIGILFCPLQLYTFWLLLDVMHSEERLGREQRRWAIIATVIISPYVLVAVVYLISAAVAAISGSTSPEGY
jgi:hypothetical protein